MAIIEKNYVNEENRNASKKARKLVIKGRLKLNEEKLRKAREVLKQSQPGFAKLLNQ